MKLDGENIWPVLAGESRGGPRTLYWKTGRQSAVRVGDWKPISGSKEAELFNLRDDPFEKMELAAKEPAKAAELRGVLAQQQALDTPVAKKKKSKDR